MADFLQKALASVGLARAGADAAVAFALVQGLRCTKEWDTSGDAIAVHVTYHDDAGNVLGTITHGFNDIGA